jgi:hypothetical protein
MMTLLLGTVIELIYDSVKRCQCYSISGVSIDLGYFISAIKGNRKRMGIPEKWVYTRSWFDEKPLSKIVKPDESITAELKYPNIQKLEDYSEIPRPDFWKDFPFRPMPRGVETPVKANRIKFHVNRARKVLSRHQFNRGMKLVDSLVVGAPAHQRFELGPISVPNTQSAIEHGMYLTDKIAVWVDSGFVAGPFEYPPLPGFRANTLLAVARNNSIRPIINMSEPKGYSFNDNLIERNMEKVWMCTAKKFSFMLAEAGVGCTMSKFDLKDAYKNIPARPEDWRIQGFSWLGRYFFETKMIFGASPSVSNFDILGATLVELAVAESGIPRQLVARALDDIPVLAPKGSDWTERFGSAFRKICLDCGVRVADNCANNIKAFENQKQGTVLGIIFNADKQEWSLAREKADKIIRSIQVFCETSYADLKQTQSVMGLVNDLSQMSPFLKFFKYSGNNFLGSFAGNELIVKTPTNQLKRDLLVCAKVANHARRGLPIAHRPSQPPIVVKELFSDAAGAKFSMYNGSRVNHSAENDRGAACFEVIDDNVVWWGQVIWPLSFLNEAMDSKGRSYGCKTTTLEAVGMLIPFLSIPRELAGQHVVLHVDNMALVYGWMNGNVKNDESASILLRAIAVIAAYLGSVVHVVHIARCSDVWSELADSLSRKSTMSAEVRGKIRFARKVVVPDIIYDWLRSPSESWDLPFNLLSVIKRSACIDV